MDVGFRLVNSTRLLARDPFWVAVADALAGSGREHGKDGERAV